MISIIVFSLIGLSLVSYGGYTTIKEIVINKRRERKEKDALLNNV
tara:strand:- start:2785 stop:2919 length:135 start_codon:yes stop_codon:yes gene_type:complete